MPPCQTALSPGPLDHVATWIFDLDNTLYPASCRLFDQVDRRIGQFIAEHFDLDPVAARALQKRYFREYGTTLRGLMTEHGIDPHRFLDYVHEIDHTPVVPDPALDRALARLAGRKLVFTNGSCSHAERVMARLGVARHFEAVFDIAAAHFTPKPELACYHALIERHGVAPAAAAMIDDIPRNLLPAHGLGMTTIWVITDTEYGGTGEDGGHIHHRTENLAAFLEAVLAARMPAQGGVAAGG
ncbi:MAG TPA: pyrimidine 5'-nucleotidase [Alphaproteobacteria bacterium]|nr:pyrimidine 5'-nucleotidase [Alphaproteobacteria bacterium]